MTICSEERWSRFKEENIFFLPRLVQRKKGGKNDTSDVEINTRCFTLQNSWNLNEKISNKGPNKNGFTLSNFNTAKAEWVL